jgi:predicted transcriptional regulator
MTKKKTSCFSLSDEAKKVLSERAKADNRSKTAMIEVLIMKGEVKK